MKNVEATFKDLFMPFQTWLISVLECSGAKTRDFDKLSEGQMQKFVVTFLLLFLEDAEAN